MAANKFNTCISGKFRELCEILDTRYTPEKLKNIELNFDYYSALTIKINNISKDKINAISNCKKVETLPIDINNSGIYEDVIYGVYKNEYFNEFSIMLNKIREMSDLDVSQYGQNQINEYNEDFVYIKEITNELESDKINKICEFTKNYIGRFEYNITIIILNKFDIDVYKNQLFEILDIVYT